MIFNRGLACSIKDLSVSLKMLASLTLNSTKTKPATVVKYKKKLRFLLYRKRTPPTPVLLYLYWIFQCMEPAARHRTYFWWLHWACIHCRKVFIGCPKRDICMSAFSLISAAIEKDLPGGSVLKFSLLLWWVLFV